MSDLDSRSSQKGHAVHALRGSMLRGVGRSASRALIVCCCAIPIGEREAAAHAVLLDTQPAARSTLSGVPTTVRLVFNERVEPVFNSIRVVDGNGRPHDQGRADVIEDGSVVEVPIDSMTVGSYTVLWQVNSIDGHQVRGYFGFGVNAPPPSDQSMLAASIVRSEGPSALYVGAVNLTALTALTVWLGGLAFLLGIYVPALDDMRAHRSLPPEGLANANCRLATMFWVSGVIFLVAEQFRFVNQTALLMNAPIREVFSPLALRTVLTSTNFGRWWSVRMLAALALFAMSWLVIEPSSLSSVPLAAAGRRYVTLGWISFAGLVLVTFPLTGHAGAADRAVLLAVVNDWLHIAGTVVWIGGLVTFVPILWTLERGTSADADLIDRLAPRFSQTALVCVVILVLTGIYNAWLHLPNWASFVTTVYGRVLLVKLVLIVLILSTAAVNRLRVVPALSASKYASTAAHAWRRRLRRLVASEVVLALPLLGLVTILVSLPPATVESSGPFESTISHDPFRVTLALHPNKVGTNHAVVVVRSASGQIVADTRDVTLFVRPLNMDSGPETFETQRTPDGSFMAVIAIPTAGESSISVQVSPPRGDTYVVDFRVYPTS